MEKKIRIGIIGCGGIANNKHMPALKKLEDVELVAFCDIIEEKAVAAKEKFGVPGSKSYVDYKELLKDETIDVVHVCTPNRSHSFISIDALEAGKHVMCEKPMAKTYEEAKAMCEASKRTGKLLTVGYQNRQRPENLYAKAVAENGELGDVYYAKTLAVRRRAVPTWGVFLNEYEQGGGPLIDIATHALDLTLWIMDNYEPAVCLGSTFRKLADQTHTGNVWGEWDPEKFTVEDSAFAFIKMKNGAVINLESSWALNIADPKEASFALCGTKAGIDTYDGVRVNYIKNDRMCIERPDLNAGGAAYFDGISYNVEELDQRKWIDTVKGCDELCVKPEQALVVTRILEGIYTSAKTGEPFIFD